MSANNTTSAATRNDIIDRATDGNPANNTVSLSARDYMQNGGGRFIRPTFASGIRDVVADVRLPRGQTISFSELLGPQYSNE